MQEQIKRKFDIRLGAKRALAEISDKATTEREKYIYGKLSNAVGIISGGVVDHTRYKFTE